MQVCCPEFNVGMLFFGAMEHDCVILVRGVRRYSKYSGYLSSFRFVGPMMSPPGCNCTGREPSLSFPDQTILTMDAVFSNHFSEKSVARDVRKAVLGFKSVRNTVDSLTVSNSIFSMGSSSSVAPEDCTKNAETVITISTGRWGSGAFGGNIMHKFLQQYVALRLVNEVCEDINKRHSFRLLFSSFNDDSTLEMLREIMDAADLIADPREIYDKVLLLEGKSYTDRCQIFRTKDSLLQKLAEISNKNS